MAFGGRSRCRAERVWPRMLVPARRYLFPPTHSSTFFLSAGGGDLEGLPDFFRQGAPTGDVGGALEDEDLDALTFGDGFDVPLDGLPEFFQQDAAGAPAHAAASELDDLGGITGISSGGES